MLTAIDQRLNTIFKTYEELRTIQATGRSETTTQQLATAFADSCVLLRDLQDDPTIGHFPEAASSDLLRQLRREGKWERFLATERQLLEITKLERGVRQELIATLDEIGQARDPDPAWRGNLERFAADICKQASVLTRHSERRSLLRRIMVAGGGALIGIMNILPPPIIQLPSQFATASISGGVWLIAKACENQLDAFFKK